MTLQTLDTTRDRTLCSSFPSGRVAASCRLFVYALLVPGLLMLPPVTTAQTVRATTFGTTSGTMPGSSRLSAGLQVFVKITQGLSSRNAAEGDEWDGVLAKDLIVGGHLITPSGTQVTGVVSKVISAKRAMGNGTIAVRLTSIHGTGVSSTPVEREGVNPALTNTGNLAAAGIPGEVPQNNNAGAAPAPRCSRRRRPGTPDNTGRGAH